MYPSLTWRGRMIETDQCTSCLRLDGGHDTECTRLLYREFTPTEQAELAWLNNRLDAIRAERAETGDETLHWQEHASICRSLKCIVDAAAIDEVAGT